MTTDTPTIEPPQADNATTAVVRMPPTDWDAARDEMDGERWDGLWQGDQT